MSELGVVVVGEIAEESFQDALLLLAQIGHVVELVQVAQIGKHLVGIGHVLVYIVEVGQQQLPPAVEVVECLVDARLSREALVQFAHQLDGVGHYALRVVAEQVTDGDIGRAPHGLASLARNMFTQEECGSLVGEHHGYV